MFEKGFCTHGDTAMTTKHVRLMAFNIRYAYYDCVVNCCFLVNGFVHSNWHRLTHLLCPTNGVVSVYTVSDAHKGLCRPCRFQFLDNCSLQKIYRCVKCHDLLKYLSIWINNVGIVLMFFKVCKCILTHQIPRFQELKYSSSVQFSFLTTDFQK